MFPKSTNFLTVACLISSTWAMPMRFQRREVPQEHSHEKFLTAVQKSLQLDNPLVIADPVFGLLGNAAAAGGAGKVTDVTCLQQETADQAFTNAKAAGDVAGMTAALCYRTLERNSGKVGLKTDLCTSVKAVNPEIAALTQHQDPASDGAQAANKALVLELAKQLASIGADPLIALDTGTFAPGDVNDPTGKGNSCDDQPDPVGCIFTKKLIVPDATEADIQSAVSGISSGSNVANSTDSAVTDVANATATAVTDVANATATATSIETTSVVDGTTTVAADASATTTAAATITDASATATDCAAASTVTVTVTVAAAGAKNTSSPLANGKKHKGQLTKAGTKKAAANKNKNGKGNKAASSAAAADTVAQTATATDVAASSTVSGAVATATDVADVSGTSTASDAVATATDVADASGTSTASGVVAAATKAAALASKGSVRIAKDCGH